VYEPNFDYRGRGHLSWRQWEDLMDERCARCEAIDGLGIQVRTDATMTPYDPSAGPTRGIMYYLRNGWEGTRAAMKPRWPPGFLAETMSAERPYQEHMAWVTRWILNGKGESISRDTTFEIWNDMAQWIEKRLFCGNLSPTAQWWHYRREKRGFYGYGGTADPHIINPWERLGQGDETKKKASAPSKYDSRFADVYGPRGRGFLETMYYLGPNVVKN